MAINDGGGCLVETQGLDPAVALFHSLSDATRLAIVHRLACGEARVLDLMAGLGLAQSTVSAHVACLRDCGPASVAACVRLSASHSLVTQTFDPRCPPRSAT